MSLTTFREALGSKLGEVITPELAAWLEHNAFDRLDMSRPPFLFGVETYNGYTIQVELARDILPQLQVLHELQWQETEAYRNDRPMKPDIAAALAQERAGQLIQFTVRTDAGELVGNLRMYLYTSVHESVLQSKEDTFFIRADHRGGFLAKHFWQFMMDGLKRIGVKDIYAYAKRIKRGDGKAINGVGRFLQFMKFTHISDGYHIHLGD